MTSNLALMKGKGEDRTKFEHVSLGRESLRCSQARTQFPVVGTGSFGRKAGADEEGPWDVNNRA